MKIRLGQGILQALIKIIGQEHPIPYEIVKCRKSRGYGGGIDFRSINCESQIKYVKVSLKNHFKALSQQKKSFKRTLPEFHEF